MVWHTDYSFATPIRVRVIPTPFFGVLFALLLLALVLDNSQLPHKENTDQPFLLSSRCGAVSARSTSSTQFSAPSSALCARTQGGANAKESIDQCFPRCETSMYILWVINWIKRYVRK